MNEFPCSVCAGEGDPGTGLPCICGGVGTEEAEHKGLRRHILILEQEIQMWRRLYLDQPEDRLYHASDATWWRRDDTQKVGQLRRAQIPEDLARKVRNLIEAAYIEGWREENRLLMDESCPPERRGAVMDINLSGDWEHSNAKLLSDRLYRPWSKD